MIRRSKAFGIIANQARMRDLLARHADQPDDPRHPEEQVNAYEADPDDPWAGDDLPDAGWETSEHGNYHQPDLDDHDDLDDCRTGQTEPSEDEREPTIDAADRSWNDHKNDQLGDQQKDDDHNDAPDHDDRPGTPWPAAFARHAEDHDGPDELADDPGHCRGCTCGSTFDLRPLSQAELTACRSRVVVHVHVSDRTLIDQHGVLRTEFGPITLEQFRRWLTDADPNLTIRPVIDPATVAPVDAYEIPMAIREAVHTRHPGSVWPHSPAASISARGRLDLDHLTAYRKNGPPGQTSVDNLGPLARSEHRPKTVANWQVCHPDERAYLWRSPHGQISLVTNQGTLLLGDSPWAKTVWQNSQAAELGRDAA